MSGDGGNRTRVQRIRAKTSTSLFGALVLVVPEALPPTKCPGD
jgi:hypothetical protein